MSTAADESGLGPGLLYFWVDGVFLTAISALGLVGTLMSIAVLARRRTRDCFSTLLTGLAVCDSFFLFFAILMFGLPMLWAW